MLNWAVSVTRFKKVVINEIGRGKVVEKAHEKKGKKSFKKKPYLIFPGQKKDWHGQQKLVFHSFCRNSSSFAFKTDKAKRAAHVH